MADQKDLDYTYSIIDKIYRFCFGETGDFSGAMYNGDFSMSLEQAQRQKHEFIADSLHIGEDSRVFDLSCGWGPFLNYIKERGAKGIGTTLSVAQVKACNKNGMDVHLMDCRKIKPETFGTFDAIVSIGGFEHFCSKEEWSKKYRGFSFRKYLFYLSLLPDYLTSKDFRKRIKRFGIPANRICFEREIMDHFRLVFEKI